MATHTPTLPGLRRRRAGLLGHRDAQGNGAHESNAAYRDGTPPLRRAYSGTKARVSLSHETVPRRRGARSLQTSGETRGARRATRYGALTPILIKYVSRTTADRSYRAARTRRSCLSTTTRRRRARPGAMRVPRRVPGKGEQAKRLLEGESLTAARVKRSAKHEGAELAGSRTRPARAGTGRRAACARHGKAARR